MQKDQQGLKYRAVDSETYRVKGGSRLGGTVL